eukprot:Rhum_TRINITY_DN14499_c0_g1::Rhum_TRINITY_DN14499_c0_g1_i1::g.91740::m.91740
MRGSRLQMQRMIIASNASYALVRQDCRGRGAPRVIQLLTRRVLSLWPSLLRNHRVGAVLVLLGEYHELLFAVCERAHTPESAPTLQEVPAHHRLEPLRVEFPPAVLPRLLPLLARSLLFLSLFHGGRRRRRRTRGGGSGSGHRRRRLRHLRSRGVSRRGGARLQPRGHRSEDAVQRNRDGGGGSGPSQDVTRVLSVVVVICLVVLLAVVLRVCDVHLLRLVLRVAVLVVVRVVQRRQRDFSAAAERQAPAEARRASWRRRRQGRRVRVLRRGGRNPHTLGGGVERLVEHRLLLVLRLSVRNVRRGNVQVVHHLCLRDGLPVRPKLWNGAAGLRLAHVLVGHRDLVRLLRLHAWLHLRANRILRRVLLPHVVLLWGSNVLEGTPAVPLHRRSV